MTHPGLEAPVSAATPEVALPPEAVKNALRRLTRTQRKFVTDGSIHGDFAMITVTALIRSGMFHVIPTSPNGRYGPARLTPLGQAVQALIKSRQRPATNTLTTGDGAASRPLADGNLQAREAPNLPIRQAAEKAREAGQ